MLSVFFMIGSIGVLHMTLAGRRARLRRFGVDDKDNKLEVFNLPPEWDSIGIGLALALHLKNPAAVSLGGDDLAFAAFACGRNLSTTSNLPYFVNIFGMTLTHCAMLAMSGLLFV